MKPILLLCTLFTFPLFAQGPLSPEGPPAPTQKSLQEIWDKIGNLESAVTSQRQQIGLLQQQNAILLENAGVVIPWRVTTVDGIGEVAPRGLAFSPSGQPAIAYYDTAADDLKYAAFNGNSWQITPVDQTNDVGKSASLAFSPAGTPAIAYIDVTHSDLKYATFSGGVWTTAPVDPNNVGTTCSLAFSSTGQATIAYHSTANLEIRYAVFDGTNWQITHVTSVTTTDSKPSLAFAPSGRPGIAFQDGTVAGIKFARWTGSTWVVDPVDVRPVDGDEEYANPSLAFSPSGLPTIAYDHYSGSGYLRVATEDGIWNIDDADQAADWGFRPSLAYSPLGRPSVSYSYDPFGDTGPLGFARKAGDDWHSQDVGPLDNTASNSSLAFGPGGLPVIAYQHMGNGSLRFAFQGPFGSP